MNGDHNFVSDREAYVHLGRLEKVTEGLKESIDHLIILLEAQNTRLLSLESSRTRLRGWIAGVAAMLTGIVSWFSIHPTSPSNN